MSAKRTARLIIERIPLISDVFLYLVGFGRLANSCRGVFSTYQEASEAALRLAPVGYNEALIYEPSVTDARTTATPLDRSDYPVEFWLARTLAAGSSVFNLGGSIGREYFAYRTKIDFPSDLRWTVCDLPHAVEVGRKLVREIEAPGLHFTTASDLASGADVFLSCGTLQYLPRDLDELLRDLPQLPRTVLVHRIPLYDGQTFFTMQHLGATIAPYRVKNRDELVGSLVGLGYKIIDAWKDNRFNYIPFHPRRTVRGYHGLFCRLV